MKRTRYAALPPDAPIEQRIEHFARDRTHHLARIAISAAPVADAVAAAYILGLNDAADAEAAHDARPR